MHALRIEMDRFVADRAEAAETARQRAALRLACGIDVDMLRTATAPMAVVQMLARLDRAIERERQKGLRRHWSYDLNRHIALKQARDDLRARMKTGGEHACATSDKEAAPMRRRCL